MSGFYIPSASESAASTPAYERSITSDGADGDDGDDEDNDLDTLPYPGELPRSDFLTPGFDAQTYLSTLRNRHQTLEDLRADLRRRSQLLNQELLDLVNGNYEEFLSLGGDLRGGEDKVEGVRLGLLGFQREIQGVKRGVKERADEVQALLQDRKAIRRDVVVGRNLLELGERLSELERRLGITTDTNEDDLFDDLDQDDGESGAGQAPVRRLRTLTEHYSLLSRMAQRIGPEQPYLLTLEPRLTDVKKTLLLDLAATLRNAKATRDSHTTITVIGLFEDLHAETEAIRVLRGG